MNCPEFHILGKHIENRLPLIDTTNLKYNNMDKKFTKRLDKFKKERNIPKLILLLEKGIYNERIAVLELLGSMEANLTIPEIEKRIDDNLEIVSQKAMTTLEQLRIDNSTKEKIKNKREYWINIENEKNIQKEKIRIKKEQVVKQKEKRTTFDFSPENRAKISSTKITSPGKVATAGIAVGVIIFIKVLILIIRHLAN